MVTILPIPQQSKYEFLKITSVKERIQKSLDYLEEIIRSRVGQSDNAEQDDEDYEDEDD